MKFFNSKVHSVYPVKGREDAACFVTSEQFDERSQRKFSVRKIDACKIDTVGDFQKFLFLDDARAAARACARGEGLSGGRRRRWRR